MTGTVVAVAKAKAHRFSKNLALETLLLAGISGRSLRSWILNVGHIETLVSHVDPDNERSSRLAERLGATLDANAQRPDPSDLVYRHYS